MMKSIEVSARTTEEAISNGLEQLAASISDVTVEILEEGSKGLFGLFGSRPAKVRLTMKEEEIESFSETHALFEGMLDEKKEPKQPVKPKAGTKPAPAPEAQEEPKVVPTVKREQPKKAEKTEKVEKAEKVAKVPAQEEEKASEQPAQQPAPKAAEPKVIVPAEQADRATPAGKAQEFLQNLTELMGVHVSVAVSTDEEGNVRVNMEGDTLGILIGRRGETLDALQYLTSLQVNKGQNDYTRVTLDTEGYRAKREEALVRLANRMANRCQKTGRKVAMEPMNPYERRILHSALQDHPAVTTHSEGEEPNRHVVITLKKEAKAEAPKEEA